MGTDDIASLDSGHAPQAPFAIALRSESTPTGAARPTGADSANAAATQAPGPAATTNAP